MISTELQGPYFSALLLLIVLMVSIILQTGFLQALWWGVHNVALPKFDANTDFGYYSLHLETLGLYQTRPNWSTPRHADVWQVVIKDLLYQAITWAPRAQTFEYCKYDSDCLHSILVNLEVERCWAEDNSHWQRQGTRPWTLSSRRGHQRHE